MAVEVATAISGRNFQRMHREILKKSAEASLHGNTIRLHLWEFFFTFLV